MIDIRSHIKNNISDFIPEIIKKIVLKITESKLSTKQFSSLINSNDHYSAELLKYLNRRSGRKNSTVEEAADTYGTEFCAFALLNISLLELSGSKDINDISETAEMSVFTALASKIFAEKTGITYPHQAYISGLFSNISYFYMNKYFHNEYFKLITKKKNIIERMNREWESFGVDHSEISYLIMGSAGFSSDIYLPVKSHHQKDSLQDLGVDHVKDISLAVYFGSMLTNLFYEDLNITGEFIKDVKKYLGLYSYQLENIINSIIDDLYKELRALNISDPSFPGYFKIINWYEFHLTELKAENKELKNKVTELNSQNTKFQKALKDNNKKLVGIALKDPLTGAFNRRYLDEKLHEEFLKAKRYSQSFILITGDIDHFKKINDTYGHAFGDQVLVKIVQIIKSSIRKTDYIARVGGEEFIIICHSSNELGGIIIAEKIRKIINSTLFNYEDQKVKVSMSFGVANYYPEIKSTEELIRISDDRLYKAKKTGRNRVVYK